MPGDEGYVDLYIQLLRTEAFRSLALAVRLVYMKGEPAYCYSVGNVLFRHGDTAVQERVAVVRKQFQQALEDPDQSLAIDDGESTTLVPAVEVLETWFHGIAFHQDPLRQDRVRELETTGARFSWHVQSTVLQLAGRILDLDDIVADFLGEDRVPRL